MSEQSLKTPLHALHVELGGKMVDFAGWELPVQYPAGLTAEHKQCRENAALFDVSHMGQVELRGENPAGRLETLVPGSITNLGEGRARYTLFTNENGGILDDLIVSNAGDHLFLVVNASMRDADIGHLRKHLSGLEVIERKDLALLALQGPDAEAVLGRHCSSAADLRFMQTTMTEVGGISCRVSRLGYTGEDGYEISMPSDKAVEIARLLLEDERCEPAGLGARDSLRLEAGLCLYGNDIDQSTTPIEAGLNWAVGKARRTEGGFPGADKILSELENGPGRKLVGVRPDGRMPARAGTEIHSLEGEKIGQVTSGGFGPTVEGPVAMGYVEAAFAESDTQVLLSIRGKTHPATTAALPFVKQNYQR